MRNLTAIFIFFSFTWGVAQQRPFINSLDKTSATVGETVAISGSGFSANVQVNFGAGVASITSNSPTLLEVVVPAAATFGPVVVTDLDTRLSGRSSQAFLPSFSGGDFDATAVKAQETFPTTQRYAYDLCACDFDRDGQVDVAVTNNNDANVSIFRNTSTVTDISFTRQNLNISFETTSADCGDLNGDGLPDLVFTSEDIANQFQVFIFRNTSSAGSVSFTKEHEFKLPLRTTGVARAARKLKIADIDGDGKRDVVIGNRSDNRLHVYRNTSTSATITFASISSPTEIILTNAVNTGALDVGDLNGNGLLDIVVADYTQTTGLIHILKNESSPGTIKFTQQLVSDASYRENVIIADFNSDNKKEIATTSINNNEVDIFENTSSGSSISFNDVPESVNVPLPYDLKAADVNGDGLTDIAVSSRQSSIVVMENTGGLAFLTKSIATANDNRHIALFDVNGDAKPDFATTNQSGETELGNLTIVANQNCLVPEIGPDNLTFCTGSPFTISATKSAGTTYTWSVLSGDATITPADDKAEVTVNSGTQVDVRVTITADDGSCTNDVSQTFTLTNGTPPPAPAITNSNTGIICTGTDFTLSGPAGQSNYFWTLPDGTELPAQSSASLSIVDPTASDAGVYKLRVRGADCISELGSINVSIDEPPLVSIINNGADTFCEGTTVQLEVPEYPGFTYQWYNTAGAISGADQATYTADASGDYSVAVISGNGCQNESAIYSVTEIAPPQSSFTAEDEICSNVEITFDASASTGESTLTYSWDFGDANTATGSSATHTFATGGTYDVVLTTGYTDVAFCTDQMTRTITVTEPQDPEITIVGGSLQKCPTDSIELRLPEGFQAYEWSTGDTEVSTYAKTGPNEDEVTVTVSGVTEIGCVFTDVPVTIANYDNSRIEITSSEATISNDEINLESGVSTVTLSASNGSEYTWEPADILRISEDGTSVVVYPQRRETFVSVTGTDAINGCITTASVTITTPGVIPRKSFSPNGDGEGYDCWEILNTDNLEGCTVYVFDQRGRYVFKGQSPFENNCVWNGNLDNGSIAAPEGIYYFVMKCDNSDFNNTGTILLAR